MTTRVSKEPERPRRFHRQSGWGDRNRQLPGPRWDAHDRKEQTTGDTMVSAREDIERVETDGGESERPISGGEGFRVSDEAVVSDDPSGQHNPMVSQGSLDGRVGVAGSRAILNRKALERVIPSGITYSRERELRWRIRKKPVPEGPG